MVSNISFNSCPDEIIQHILSFVDVSQLGKCASVCKRWNQILQSWELRTILINLQIKKIEESPEEFINKRQIDSLETMFVQLNEFFVKQLEAGQQGLFRCVFLSNSDCRISILCGRNLKEVVSENSALKVCFFREKLHISKETEMKTCCGDTKNGYDHFFQWKITLPQVQLNIPDIYCDKVDKKMLTCFTDSYLELKSQKKETESLQEENKKTPHSLKRVFNYITRKK